MKKRVISFVLALVMLISTVPASVISVLAAEIGAPEFSEEVIAAMQEVCGDRYDAVDVLGALYQIGAVDKNGVPILTDTFEVDGKTVNAEELRAMADSHLSDPEDSSVVVDGEALTWGQLRTMFAMRDMQDLLLEAQEQGIAMNDAEHIDTANSLMRFLSSGMRNEQEWYPVTHVGHIGAATMCDGLASPYYFNNVGDMYYRETMLQGSNLFGKSATTQAAPRQDVNDVFASKYTPEHPDRLYLPAAQSKYYGQSGAEYTLVTDSSGTAYAGEYDYLSQLDFFLTLPVVVSSSGYDAQKVRITLHAESAEDVARADGGTLALSWMSLYSEPEDPIIDPITLTAEKYAAMVSEDGLEIGVLDMDEVRDSYGVFFSLRASSKPLNTKTNYTDTEDTFGSIRAAGLYMTFEVQGEKIAPAASANNTRLWLNPVADRTDYYTLNPDYCSYESVVYGLHLKEQGTAFCIPNISEKVAANGGYVDLLDNYQYLVYYVMTGNTVQEQAFARQFSGVGAPASGYGRLFLNPLSVTGTQYQVNTTLTDVDLLWRYGFNAETVYDIPDALLTNTCTYSFIDFKSFIQSYDVTRSHDNLMVDALTLGSGSASQAYTFQEAHVNRHHPVPAIIWNSADNLSTRFTDYGLTASDSGKLTASYSVNNDRAVLVQARFLNYLRPLAEQAYPNSQSSSQTMTETPWVVSQYGVYDKTGSDRYTHYDFAYNSNNPAADENLHIVAPAMVYYPGEVIPLIVRNPNGVFGNPEGSTAAERDTWAQQFRLSINGKPLEPVKASFRMDTSDRYGVDMLVFLFPVSEFEAGQLDFANARISYGSGEKIQMVNDVPDESAVTLKSFDWSSLLLVNDYKVTSEGAQSYVEIPIRTDLTTEQREAMIQQLNNWTDQGATAVKNAYALLSTSAHPTNADRTPIYPVITGTDESETYTAVRIPLPTQADNGSPIAYVRIFVGSPTADGSYTSYDSAALDANPWSSDGFTCADAPYRTLGTILARLPKITYFEDESRFTLIYNDEWKSTLDYREYRSSGKPDILLSYDAPLVNEDGEAYSFIDAKCFSWKSNDESIATVENRVVDGKTMAVVNPTGVPGSVTFTLTCENGGGDHAIEMESLEMTVVFDSQEAYLMVPDTLSTLVVRKNAPASVTFASNIQQFNANEGQAATNFTLKVYPAELSGGVLVRASDTPVFAKTETANAENPVYAIRIPANILSTVSPMGSESYLAEITADYIGKLLPLEQADGHFSVEIPVKVKNLPVQVSISPEDSAYLLGGDKLTASWTVENTNPAYDWRYYITDESGALLDEYSAGGALGFDRFSLEFTAPEVTDVLKRTYTLTVAASNDLSDEGWTLATKTIHVYNRNALDILVEGVENKVAVHGDRVTMDSRPWLQQYLSSDGKTVKLGSDSITFGELQTDAHLDALISLNYGDYAWGLISDAIEWKVTDDTETDPVDLYYKSMGVFADTETSGLTTYLPTTDFRLIAAKDGEVTVTAKHARSGISSSVKVDVDTLDNELILFQFHPVAVTTVTYTLKNGQQVTVKSDENGQLALYEASRIDDDTRFYLTSEYDMMNYVGMTTMGALKSGEKNAVNGKTYPVNLVKLQKPAEIHLYMNGTDGKPIESTDFTVRGGVYYDGAYAPHADLFDVNNRTQGNIAGDESSGLNDLTYTTDEHGMFRVFFNLAQFTGNGTEPDPEKSLNYILEIRKDGYRPEIVLVDPYRESNVVVELTSVTEEETNKPFLWDFSVKALDGSDRVTEFLPLDDSSVKIGPNQQHKRIALAAETALWGMPELVDRSSGVTQVIANPGSQYYTDEGALTKAGNGQSADCQTCSFWAYPFSSFVFCNTTLEANPISLNWLEEKTELPMDLHLFDKNGKEAAAFPFDYELFKSLEPQEPTDSKELQENMAKQKEQIEKATKDFGLGTLVPGGDILATGLTFLSSSASGGNYGIQFKVSPTADPTIYYVMISVTDEEPEDDDDDDKDYELKPEYEDIQKLGAEAISAFSGASHFANYTSKKKGLAATLKEEAENIWKSGEENKKEDKKDDDDDDDDLPIKIGGTLIARATYDVEHDDWSLSVSGGGVHFSWEIGKWEYHKNLIVGYVPVTVSIGIKLGLKAEMNGRTAPTADGKEDSQMLMGVNLKSEIEGFGGLGMDVSVVALKIGFYGKFEAAADAQMLVAHNNSYYGANINLKGELGIKFVFKALVVSFEYEICSLLKIGGKDGKDITAGNYNTIQDIWKGKDANGTPFTAAATPDGKIQFTLEKMEATPVFLAPASNPGSTIFHTYEENAALEELQYSEDGQMIFYLDDGVAFAADAKGITEAAISQGAENDFGQFYLDAAGRNGNYAAAWVTQTCKDNIDESQAPTAADLAAALNSTEITAAICRNSVWTTEQLTCNSAPDLAPAVAVSEDGRYVLVAWRSVYNSNPDAPLTFDVDDNLVYRIWDSTTGLWTEPETAYNGIANGSVYALDAAVFNNGNVLLAYTVQTDAAAEEAENGLETFYTFLQNTSVGRINTTVRVTDNDRMDANAQLIKLTEDGNEYAVLGWYTREGDGDICLRVFDANGSIDDSYPTSVARMSDVRISESFRLAGSARDDLSIGWINVKNDENDAAASGELCAARIYRAQDSTYRVAPAQVLAASSADCTVDDFALFAQGRTVTALLSETDYTSGETKVSATFRMDDMIRPELYETTEDYESACAMFLEEHPDGTFDFVTPVGHYKAERKTSEFRNELSVTKIRWNQDTVASMLTVPVTFTVRNDGYAPVDSLSINGTVFADSALQPGESTKLTVNYTMDQKASDQSYTISVPGEESFAPVTDTLHFNTPEVTILDAHQTEAADGKRTVVVRLGNSNMVHAALAERTYRVAIYADAECTKLVSQQMLDAATAKMMDENAAVVPFRVNVQRVLTHLEMSGMEIPETGIALYVKADTCMPDGEVLETTIEPVFISTLCTDPENPVTADCTDFTVNDNRLEGEYTIMNTSVNNQGTMTFGICVRDRLGRTLVMERITQSMTAEKIVTGTYSIPVSDPEQVVSVTMEMLPNGTLPTPEAENYTFGGWYQDVALTQAATADASLAYAKWNDIVLDASYTWEWYNNEKTYQVTGHFVLQGQPDREETVLAASQEIDNDVVYTAVFSLGTDTKVVPKENVPTECIHKTEIIPGKDATCTESGLTEGAKCVICGEILTKQEVIPAKGHVEVVVPGVEATETETGLTDGVVCEVCGEILVAQEVIPLRIPFAITAQPENFVGPIGSEVSFHVDATGNDLTYQWFYSKEGVVWQESTASGAKTDTLNLSFTAIRAGQLYRCEIRNDKGELLTTNAVFMCEALPPIVINQQPVSFMGEAGEMGVFHVDATGKNLTYQWYYSKNNGVTWNKSVMEGSNTDTMKVELTSARAGQCYRCEVRDEDGNLLYTQQAAIKLETEEIEIKYQPVSANGYIGESTTFHVEATGMGLTYQWYYSKNGGETWSASVMEGNQTDTLNVQLTEARVGQCYRCAVTDSNGTTVYTDVVAMNQKISVSGIFEIQAQPQSFTGKVGDTAAFYVDAVGENLTFQWQFSKNGKTWSASSLPGNKTDTLRVDVTAARIGQQYRCVITDATGSQLISDVVTINQA